MPSDEALEYLVTQAIADFLAVMAIPSIDGIVFPSVQSSGDAFNVILFHKAARVEEIELPKGMELSASYGTLSERSEEHTSELQSLMRISYAVFCLKKKKKKT